MRILIIIANPRPHSFSHQIAEAYQEGAIHSSKTVQILDLYDTHLQLDYLRPETKVEFAKQQPIREALQQLILDSDEIVIIHPLWWGGMPAILKNFIDQIFTPGFAYRRVRRRYLPRWFDVVPKRLLRGKHARLFITCDGQAWTNALRLWPYLLTWQFYILQFTGLKLRSFQLFTNMRGRSNLKRSKWLARVNRLGAR